MLECILIGTATDLTCKPRSINEWSIEKLQCISSFFCCAISNKCKLPRPSIPASTKCYHKIWSFDSEKVGMWVCVCASDMQSQVFKHKALLYYIWCRAYIKPFLTINLLYKHTIHEDTEIWRTSTVCEDRSYLDCVSISISISICVNHYTDEKTHLVFIILTSVTSPLALNWSLSLSSVM